jgi:hypothetical protein
MKHLVDLADRYAVIHYRRTAAISHDEIERLLTSQERGEGDPEVIPAKYVCGNIELIGFDKQGKELIEIRPQHIRAIADAMIQIEAQTPDKMRPSDYFDY